MEQEKSFKFKLFVPPRLSNTQVSAVKPQTNTRDGGFIQNFNNGTEDYYNSSLGMKNTSKHIEVIDPALQKVKYVPETEQENMETMNGLYSRLYKEAEKIKRWKVSVQYELKEKDRKLQENRKIIEALRKAIQELQFENEKLSLKLEDEIHENNSLLKENNATRHLCNLLKEKCMQSMEKSNKYEYEREETRQMYVDLNNDIERMIKAFEELRVEAENSRLEKYYRLKEAADKIEQLEKGHDRELNAMEKQVSILTKENSEKDNKMKDINSQLQESKSLIIELKDIRKQQDEILKKAETKQQCLLTELENIKKYLEETKNTCKNLETDLQTTVKTLVEVTEQKELTMKELEGTRVLHASVIDGFQTKISNLKEMLMKEENRQKELRDDSDALVLELQNRSAELERMTKLKNDKEKQIEELEDVLKNAIKVQKDLEQQLECIQSEKLLLIKEKEIQYLTQVQVQELLDGKQILEKTIEKLQERESELKETLQTREKEMHDLERQLSDEFKNKQYYFQQLTTLKAELEKEILKNKQLNVELDKLLLEKEQITIEKKTIDKELQKFKKDLKGNKNADEESKKQIENLKQTNLLLSDELEGLKEEIKKKDEETKSKVDEHEENVRSIEGEISKKEKQLKTLENKVNSLKKQIEIKAKNIEELQQENKTLKKKVATESKHLSISEGQVNKLQLELEKINKLHKETVDNYKNEIEMARADEKRLLNEVETMNSLANEAVAIQKELDIRCQHKITEMVALMEKHKHQYDKTVDEKDTELEYYKTKQQELSSTIGSLESELSCKKNEVFSLQEQLKREINEKETLTREVNKKMQTSLQEIPDKDTLSVNSQKNFCQYFLPIKDNTEYIEKSSWTSTKTYSVKTPPKSTLPRESTNLLSEGRKKKRKVILELDTHSDTSENTDLLSIMTEQEMFKKTNEGYPESSHLHVMTPKQAQAPFIIKTPGSSIKLANIRKVREAGWTAVSKMDRKKKMKEAGKLFT